MLLSYKEVKEVFKKSDYRLWACAYTWDSYYETTAPEKTVIKGLSVYFPNNADARACKPLGDFRKIKGKMAYDHEAIYNFWLKVLYQKQYSAKIKEEKRMITVALAVFARNIKMTGKNFSKEEIEVGFSMLLYRTLAGISAERDTVNMLKRVYGAENVSEASYNDESRDVDAYVYGIPVSIKSGLALSQSSIHAFRRRGKTDPVVYAGPDSEGNLKALLPESFVTEVSESDLRILSRIL